MIPSKPLWIASGPWGLKDGVDTSCVRAYTTKSVTPYPKKGNSGEIFKTLPHGYFNRLGLPNVGLEEWVDTYEDVGLDTFVSLANFTPDDILYAMSALKGLPGVVGVELNYSCPSFGVRGKQYIKEVANVVMNSGLLCFLKTPANQFDIRMACHRANRGHFHGLVVSNSHPGVMKMGDEYLDGGTSGPAIKNSTAHLVKYACSLVKEVPVVACGGTTTGQDVKDYLTLGATYVQVGSAHIDEPDCTTRIMAEYLELG